MPVRHCVFIADLAEMEKSFQLPLSVYVDEFLERPTPGDRLREYAELAFADEQQIQTLRKADRETMVMARRLTAAGQGPRTELPQHMNDVTGDYVKTRTTSQFKWLLHSFGASGRSWIREFVCSSGREWVVETVNLLFVQGSVPGPTGGLVLVKESTWTPPKPSTVVSKKTKAGQVVKKGH